MDGLYLRTGGSVSCSDCVTYQPPLAEAEEALPAVLTSIPAVSAVVPRRVLFGRLSEKGSSSF